MKSNKYLDSLNTYEFSEEALARKVYRYENPQTGQIYEYNRTGYYVKDGVVLRLLPSAEADRPGLWENIRRKKEREGKNYKPAKTVKEGRPTQEQLKRAQSEPSEKQKKALDKNKDGKITKEDFELLRKDKK